MSEVTVELAHRFRAHYPDGTTSEGGGPYVGTGSSDAEATANACRAFISDEFDAGRVKPDRIEILHEMRTTRKVTIG